MSRALISKITKRQHHTLPVVENKVPIGEPSFEVEDALWKKVKFQRDYFILKEYFPNEDYIHMMYALIYVYNSYASPENRIDPPVLNVAYHWDRANKVYVVNLTKPEGIKLADNINYLVGRGTRSWDYVNLKQVLNPSSLTDRARLLFLSSIVNQDTTLQYPVYDEEMSTPMKQPETPKKTPGQKLTKEELSRSISKELNDLYKIYQSILDTTELIQKGVPYWDVHDKYSLIKSEINNNTAQLEVTITHSEPIEKFYKKYDKLLLLVNKIASWQYSNPGVKVIPRNIQKVLDEYAVEFKSSKVKGVELFPEEKVDPNRIPNNVMRVMLSDSLYMDIKLR
jgi:hypothetical protein